MCVWSCLQQPEVAGADLLSPETDADAAVRFVWLPHVLLFFFRWLQVPRPHVSAVLR